MTAFTCDGRKQDTDGCICGDETDTERQGEGVCVFDGGQYLVLAQLVYISNNALVTSHFHHPEAYVLRHSLNSCLYACVCLKQVGSLTFLEWWAFYCPVSTLCDRVWAKRACSKGGGGGWGELVLDCFWKAIIRQSRWQSEGVDLQGDWFVRDNALCSTIRYTHRHDNHKVRGPFRDAWRSPGPCVL